MAQRDRVAEIASIVKRGEIPPSGGEIHALRQSWATQLSALPREIGESSPVSDFIPIRLVTLIEVFSKTWLARLIDHGPPFAERVTELKVDLKFDLTLVRSLQGKVITLGQLVAHSVPLQNIASLAGTFTAVLGRDLFQAISKTPDRIELEYQGDAAQPIIKDLSAIRSTLARLFEVRHILVHEFPLSRPYEPRDIEFFLDAAYDFVRATEETLSLTLHGPYPITQQEMTARARSDAQSTNDELVGVVQEVAKYSPSIVEVQKLWDQFKVAEANREAQEFEGGTIQRMIYYGAEAEIAKERAEQLRKWLKPYRQRHGEDP
jgi:hypothetical protein